MCSLATEATVFNIQKFSVDDGPGIRTTVFLKGCPLHCPWCSNPESQLRHPQMEWNAGNCLECGHCLEVAPAAGASERGGKRHVDIAAIDAAGTDGGAGLAARLVAECPGKALTISGETRGLEDVLAVCLQDKPFYEESGGGVTFSGGEALLWSDFVVALSERLHQNEVSACIETTAFASAETFQKVAACMDHMLIDLKHWDAETHQQVVGVPLDPILVNIKLAIDMGKDVLVRIPVIPGFNFTDAAAEGFAARLAQVGATKVQLLPYHNYGENKYSLIGKDYALATTKALHAEDLADMAAALREHGLEVTV